MTRGHPRTFDPEQMLDQAMQVFWQRGYEATSLQDLLAATGLSKSSLYQTYPSKRALFEAALRQYCSQRRRELRERLQAAASPREFLRAWLLCALEEERAGEPPRGCMLANVASEFSQADPEIAALLDSAPKQEIVVTDVRRHWAASRNSGNSTPVPCTCRHHFAGQGGCQGSRRFQLPYEHHPFR